MTQTVRQAPADYTEGSITSSILKMGLPSMLGFITQNVYTLIDTWWVSRLPEREAAVAALTFFGAILMFLFSFNQLVGPGSVAVISRRYGEKNFALAEKAIKETLLLKLAFGFLFGGIGFLFSEELLRLVGAEGEALRLGVEYASVMFVALGLPYAMYSVFTALRSVANPHLSMVLMIGSNVLNMVLDPVFIFGWFGAPALGIRGAAVASVISFAVTLLAGLGLMYAGRANVRLHFRGRERISWSSMWNLIRIGLPAWVSSLSFSISRLIISPLVAGFGTAVVAAYGVGTQVLGFGVMVVVGIGLGLSSLIGHNLGSGKPERARHTADRAILMAVMLMAVFGALCFVLARPIMRLFFDSPETIATGVTLLRIFALSFPMLGAFIMIEEVHMGVGLNTPMMVFEFIQSWPLQVLPVWFAIVMLQSSPVVVWWIMTLSYTLSATGVYFYYRRGRWLTTQV